MIVIVDYGMGNLRSVEKKLNHVSKSVLTSSDRDIIKKASKLILPGVGHFATGIKNLKEREIWDVLNEKVLVDKTPILGICLGMQIMTNYSEEGSVEGLGWIDADVVRFQMKDYLNFKVPHVGWNSAKIKKDSLLFKGIPADTMFYFVHSYYVRCQSEKDILTTTEYEHEFVSAIEKDNIYGTQFHPEKSHSWGEEMLRNFAEL